MWQQNPWSIIQNEMASIPDLFIRESSPAPPPPLLPLLPPRAHRLQKNCRKLASKPMMDSLPKSRLHLSPRAFKKVGGDFVVIFLTRQGRGKTRGKRYLCFFNLSYNTKGSFRNVLLISNWLVFNRMTSSKGIPRYVISDKGSYLGGAERELRQLVEVLDPDRLPKKLPSVTPLTGS